MKFINYPFTKIEKRLFSELDIYDPFFNSLRKDYHDFNKWFKNKQTNNEYCFVYYNENEQIGGLLYLKLEFSDESYNNFTPNFTEKKRIKVGTFKVSTNKEGIGERFIKIIFDHAVLNDVEEIYVTIFNTSQEKIRLIELLKKFGFKEWGDTVTSEKIYNRQLQHWPKTDDTITKNKLFCNYPFVNFEFNNFYILPIESRFHAKLLPDCEFNKTLKPTTTKNMAWMNAIDKYYIGNNLTWWDQQKPRIGDAILFYRFIRDDPTQRLKGYSSILTGIGILIKIGNLTDDIKRKILSRSVFDEHDLRRFNSPKYLEFLFLDSIEPINLLKLRELNIFSYKEGPRGLFKLSHSQKKIILNLIKMGTFSEYYNKLN